MRLQRVLGFLFLCGVGLVLLSVSGTLRSIDGWFFDLLVRMSPSKAISSTDLLVVESRAPLGDEQMVELAAKLDAQGARLTVFIQGPGETVDPATQARLDRDHALACPGPDDTVAFSPPRDGIWRGFIPRGDGAAHAAFQTTSLIAEALQLTPPAIPFYLDFQVRRDGYQWVEARRLLAGDLPRSLVDGKVIVVGADSPADAMITTPRHKESEALHPLLLQAVVIDALLREGTIRLAPVSLRWVEGFALAGVFGLIAWRRQYQGAAAIAAAGIVLAVAAAWAALWTLQWWMPPTLPTILLCMGGVLATSVHGAIQRKSLRQMLRNLAVDVQERAEQGGFLKTNSPWEYIQAVLDQSFDVRSGFVLRADEKSGALEAATETARSASRGVFAEASLRVDEEPFAIALREKSTILEDGWVVLPIRGQGRVFGFWVFQPAPDEPLEPAVGYANRLGAMMERRAEWRRRARPSLLEEKDTADLKVRPLHDQLEGSIDLLDRGLHVLAEALDSSREAVLVFDPFGRLTHASRNTINLLEFTDFDYTTAPPIELLGKLSGTAPAEVRRTLRYVALSGEEAVFKAIPDLMPGREFFIYIRTLQEAEGTISPDRPELPGLILMIDDVTQTARTALLKDEFLEHIYYQLNNDFEAVMAASPLLNDPRVDAGERDEILGLIVAKVEESSARIRQTRTHLQTEFNPAAVERYPVRFETVFNAARASVAPDLESHLVTILSAISDYLQLVLAGPTPLETLLRAMLLTLIHDSREESQITVEAVQSPSELRIRFQNDGFGMPQETLDQYLRADADGQGVLASIGAGQKTVEAWGGSLGVRSDVGLGMIFDLTLKSVI